MEMLYNFREFPTKIYEFSQFRFYPYLIGCLFGFSFHAVPFLSFFVLYEEKHMFLTVCDGSVINGQL
jgi:hypothetical protein